MFRPLFTGFVFAFSFGQLLFASSAMTLTDRKGDPIRATPMVIAKALPEASAFAANFDNWEILRDKYAIKKVVESYHHAVDRERR